MDENFIKALADIFLPRHCPVCGRKLLESEDFLCTDCLCSLPLTHFSHLRENPMAENFSKGDATALYYYRGGYKSLSRTLKYRGGLSLGRNVADLLARDIAGSDIFNDIDIIIPVPLHPLRHISRGYNQARVIADRIGAATKADVRADLLRRHRFTRSQAGISRSGKASNVSGAFRVRLENLPDRPPRHILLVDDVYTTGSTMKACRDALEEALKARYGENASLTRISAATLAYAGE